MPFNKNVYFIFSILLSIASLIYYYFGSKIPLEITIGWVRLFMIIVFLFIPIGLGVMIGFIITNKYQKNKLLGCSIPLFVFAFLIHNLIWTIIVSWFIGGYEDMNITYPEKENKKHKIIIQYKDEGALGGHYRRVDIYEITPFLRYINESEFTY